MSSSPATLHHHQAPDLERALERAMAAISAASADDLHSLGEVPRCMAELERALAGDRVPPARHPAVRAELDRLMAALGGLITRVVEARDEVGVTLAKLRRQKRMVLRGADPARSSLDVHR